jgi:outer membrane receptor protein involved in Fe transport
MNQRNGITRAVLYARVSIADRQRPEMQLAELREHAKRRGWKVVGEFTDRVSGAKESRPALNKLMQAAHRGWQIHTRQSGNGKGARPGEGKCGTRVFPYHLPSYRTVDVSVGKSFGESWSIKITGLNVTNKRYQLDLSNTFGGSHFAYPRTVAVQLRYRLHY